MGAANTDLGILRPIPKSAFSPMVFSTTRDGPQAQKGSAALLLMSTTVLTQLLKLLVTFTVVLVTFTTLLVTFTAVLVQQFLWLVQSVGYSS